MINTHLYTIYNKYSYVAMKQQQLTISISTINDTDYFGKGISLLFLLYFSDCSAGIIKNSV
jgi:hypothetical protein